MKHDSDSLLRKRVREGLTAAASRREAAAALERILRDLHVSQARPERIPDSSVKDHEIFAGAAAAGVPTVESTGESSERSRPLFWNEGLGTRIQEAFDQLKDLITPVREETPPGGVILCSSATFLDLYSRDGLSRQCTWNTLFVS